MKNRALTNFAKGVVYLIGIGSFVVLFILIPELVREEGVGKPFDPLYLYSFFTGLYILAIPFFVALHQTLKLIGYMEKNKAFSIKSIKALKYIKICAIIFSILIFTAFATLVTLLRINNPGEDAPPFMMLGTILTFISSIIAVFMAVLQKLLTEAVAIKSENDLIV
jgi:hypothetical protein